MTIVHMTLFHTILMLHQVFLLLDLTVDYSNRPAQGKQQITVRGKYLEG